VGLSTANTSLQSVGLFVIESSGRYEIDDCNTCSQCGAHCVLDPFIIEGKPPQVAFICAEHGVNAVLDPFESDE